LDADHPEYGVLIPRRNTPALSLAAPGVLYRDFFMKDRNGAPKGVVNIDLGSLP
jgi:hypothetical protein